MAFRLTRFTFLFVCLVLGAAPSLLWSKDSKESKKLYQHAEGLLLKWKLDEAIEQFREAIALQPDEARYHAGLALALEDKADLYAALDEYRLALQLDPKDREVRRVYEELAEELKDPEVAAIGLQHKINPAGRFTEVIRVSGREPSYSEGARREKVQGEVVMSVIIGADGSVKSVHLRKGLDPGLDKNAIETIRTWKFKPATLNGEPVASRVLVTTSFRFF